MTLGAGASEAFGKLLSIGDLFGIRRQTADKPIKIPESKLEAQGDSKIITRDLPDIEGLPNLKGLKLIELLYPGNCAEYTTIDMAMILKRLNGAINPKLDRILNNLTQQSVNTIERDYVIPVIDQASEHLGDNIRSANYDGGARAAHVQNLIDKLANPTEPLDGMNAVMLFKASLQPNMTEFEKGDLISGNSQDEQIRKWLNDAFMEETQALMIGFQPENGIGHQVGALKLGEFVVTVDTLKMLQDEVLVVRSVQGAEAWTKRLIAQPRSFAVKVTPLWN